jgi:hypothetical protein
MWYDGIIIHSHHILDICSPDCMALSHLIHYPNFL